MEVSFQEMHFFSHSSPVLHCTPCGARPSVTMSGCSPSLYIMYDKVLSLTWQGQDMSLSSLFNPAQEEEPAKQSVFIRSCGSATSTTLASVHGTEPDWVLTCFRVNEVTLERVRKSIASVPLPSKPTCVHLYTHSTGDYVLTTFYTKPLIALYSYNEGCLVQHDVSLLFPGLAASILWEVRVEEFMLQQDYVICVDTVVDKERQYLACGTVYGNVHVFVTDDTGVLWSAVYDWEGPVASVKWFYSHHILCLVVACMVEQVVLFTDVDNNKLDQMMILPQSTQYDSVTCVCVMDIDYNKEMEIIVGTYGSWLIVYKLNLSTTGVISPAIHWKRQFSSPVYDIVYSDVTGDGLYELVILSFSGVHILQRDLQAACRYIRRLLIGDAPKSEGSEGFESSLDDVFEDEPPKDEAEI